MIKEAKPRRSKMQFESGDRYGNVMLTGKCFIQVRKSGNRRTMVEYICQCKNISWTRLDGLISGHATSCGCAHIKSITTNGISRHPLNNVYGGMMRRCYDEKCEYYPNYGGRGVIVCDEWKNNIMTFFNWAISNGWRKGLELDKDKLADGKNGLLYSPEFCCFLTHQENTLYTSSSKVVEYKGENKNLSVWCELLNLPYKRIQQRISRDKWDAVKAFETPPKSFKKVS